MLSMYREIGGELIKLSVQKKNYVAIVGHLIFLALCYLAYRLSGPAGFLQQHAGRGAGANDFSNLVQCIDGLFFSRLALYPTFLFLMPILVATIGGDIVAGEIQDGSLKLYLARPRSRTRVMFSKFISLYIACLGFSLYFSIFAILCGCAIFGFSWTQIVIQMGDQLSSAGLMISTAPFVLCRYFLTVLYYSFSLMALGAIALFFSTLFNRMTAATVSVITLHFVSYGFAALPIAEPLRPWMLSNVMSQTQLLWMPEIPLSNLIANLATISFYIAVMFLASCFVFNSKDIK